MGANRETTRSLDGHVEINAVVYDRTDGLGDDRVLQVKEDGYEVSHTTLHPDGSVHSHKSED